MQNRTGEDILSPATPATCEIAGDRKEAIPLPKTMECKMQKLSKLFG